MNDNKLRKFIREILDDEDIDNLEDFELEDDLDEISTTSNVAGYQSKFAFGDDENSKSKKKKYFHDKGYDIQEATYKQLKSLDQSNNRTLNALIQQINGHIFKAERTLNQALKLKSEDGLSSGTYWKSTFDKLKKAELRISRLISQLKQLY